MGSLCVRTSRCGKSAIAQTIAELWHTCHLLLASFFFSRTDPKRNNAKSHRKYCILCKSLWIYQIAVEPLTHWQLSITGTFTLDSTVTSVPNLIIIDELKCRKPQVQQHILHGQNHIQLLILLVDIRRNGDPPFPGWWIWAKCWYRAIFNGLIHLNTSIEGVYPQCMAFP